MKPTHMAPILKPTHMAHILAPAPWDKRKLSAEDLATIHPLCKEQEARFSIPSIRVMADADTREWLVKAYGVPAEETFFAMDMEIIHIHDKVGRLLFTKNSKKPRLAERVVKDGHEEWRFWPQFQSGINLRRDDYVLFKIALTCQGNRAVFNPPTNFQDEYKFTLEQLCVFFLDRFAKYRFWRGRYPLPIGKQPDETTTMYANEARQNEAVFQSTFPACRWNLTR